MTNAERQHKYRERQLLHNKEAYDKKISLKMKKLLLTVMIIKKIILLIKNLF